MTTSETDPHTGEHNFLAPEASLTAGPDGEFTRFAASVQLEEALVSLGTLLLSTPSVDAASPAKGTAPIAEAVSARTASSRSKGLLVAASTMTLLDLSVSMPSHSCMNSVLRAVVASCSCERRLPSRLSTSSAPSSRQVSTRHCHHCPGRLPTE